MIRWAIGYDPREAGAFYTFAHTLQSRSSVPIAIIPVALSSLSYQLTRGRDPMQSNDFAFSRWLVPWMCEFEGWAVFSDCDMLALDDPAKLWALKDDRYAIQCVQHDYRPENDRKYLGNEQTSYPRKCWSSLMLMNCSRLRMLSPGYVNKAQGLDLHQFKFLPDQEIGALPGRWNHLVGHDRNASPAVLHWTEGGPYFEDYRDVDHADLFWSSFKEMVHVDGGVELR